MAKRKPKFEQEEKLPLQLPDPIKPERSGKELTHPIWTENKANLIERYLYYFVMVTKHGTYIDGFAGPQTADRLDLWSAKLVLESQPRWLRNFYLCDNDKKQVESLKSLTLSQPQRAPKEPKRTIKIYEGDFNFKGSEILQAGAIKEKEAAFCLLDQRTFECHWSTVKTLADHKTSGNKIELFYFLPTAWLDRALSNLQNPMETLQKWWGENDCDRFLKMKSYERLEALIRKFKKDLGYWSVRSYEIRERRNGGRIMYYMIHATDHSDAPTLMNRAYRRAVQPKEPLEQLLLEGVFDISVKPTQNL